MKAQEIELTEDMYEQILNDLYGTIEVGNLSFDAGAIVRELDPTAFRCGMADEPINWQCGECLTEYGDDEDGANECCKEDEEEKEETPTTKKGAN